MIFENFFFLRPLWLLALVPVAWLVWLTWRGGIRKSDSGWRGLVDPHLLEALAVPPVDGDTTTGRWRALALAAGLSAAVFALAGPAWQKIDLPTFQTKEPVVVALSLAQSMNADDVAPSRLTRAGHKLRDILAKTSGGDTGFVLYSDVAFVAAPLTSDGEVIAEMLPELSTDLMPTLGNRPDQAIAQATALLERAGAAKGRIVLLADTPGSDPDATIAAAHAAAIAGYTVHTIGVGADAQVPLQTASGRILTDQAGQPMSAGYDPTGLAEVARNGDGSFSPLTPGPADVEKVLAGIDSEAAALGAEDSDLRADSWADMGFWLLLIPVLLAPLAFRRNALMCAALVGFFGIASTPSPVVAQDATAILLTPDQRAARAFQAEDYEAAAELFERGDWRGAAAYRAGDYATAAKAFMAQSDRPVAGYNLGNALARSGALEEALAVYDRHLEAHPDDEDAQFNRDLVARLLDEMRQQDQQQDQQQSGGEQQDQQQSGGDQQEQQQSGGEQEEQQQPGGDQQDQQQPGGEQQDEQQPGGDQQEQQQSGGEQQDQQKSGGEQQEQQQPGGEQQNQQQPGGEQQEQTESEVRDEPGAENTVDAEEDGTDRSAFQQAMDALLGGNRDPGREVPETEEDTAAEVAVPGFGEQEQAIEQMLRRVPDDSSGLLRARIRQHYLERR